VPFDIVAQSNQPYNAAAWYGRRQNNDLAAAARGRCVRFTKMNFIDLALSQAGAHTDCAGHTYTCHVVARFRVPRLPPWSLCSELGP